MMWILWGLGTTLCEDQGFANMSVSRPLMGGGFETLSGKGDCFLGTLEWQQNVKLTIHRVQIRKQTPLSAFDTKPPMMTFYFHIISWGLDTLVFSLEARLQLQPRMYVVLGLTNIVFRNGLPSVFSFAVF